MSQDAGAGRGAWGKERGLAVKCSFWAATERAGCCPSASWVLWPQGGPSALEWTAYFWKAYVPRERWGRRLLPLQATESAVTHGW